MNPYQPVIDFENVLAEFCGSKYAVCVESCTMALFLSLKCSEHYGNWTDSRIEIPCRTYPGVACSIIHAGLKVRFMDIEWQGEYELAPLNIWDAALRFKRGMYHGGFQCLSFHLKKTIKIGRGGAILTDDKISYEWLKRARFDGRNPVPLQEDDFTMLGWNAYMQPADAARGLQYFQMLCSNHPDGVPDLKVEDQKYNDLSKFKIYTQ